MVVSRKEEKQSILLRLTTHSEAESQAELIQSIGKQISLFKYLSAVEKEVLYSFAKKITFDDGVLILKAGHPGKGLFMIERGTALVTRPCDDDEEEVVLATIEDGGHFGEMSLLDQLPLSANVRAKGRLSVYLMRQQQFSSLLALHKAISNKLLRAMCEELSNRLRRANLFVS